MINNVLGQVSGGTDLSREQMAAAIGQIMDGQWQDDQIALLLSALRAKGVVVDELVGAAEAMREHMTAIRGPHADLLDTCGTGGDGSQTFNISTAAALVAAATGVPVAKHGNRGMTSKSGSANVLAELGVNIEADVATIERCLAEVGLGFCFAPMLHPSMKHVAPVRKKLGVPTIFNMLGPLCNPASAMRQLLGVGNRDLQQLLGAALQQLGTTHALLVHGADGLDEVSLAGETYVLKITPTEIIETVWNPQEFGIESAPLSGLTVDGPGESADVIRQVLAGEVGPARDIVVLNAAAALLAAEKTSDPSAAAEMAMQAIDSGAAKKTLDRLVACSQN